ncbi:MAG TPA: prolyl oligopeptidase family serine peptidase [Nocardioidaceae bacterium]|nr:prolyl oligopeptidase family serine peptidase [Nocardioidaceae bacterium]
MSDLPRYPPARRDDLVEVLHGNPVADPYRWLEDGDSPDTTAWLDAQDDLLDARRGEWTMRQRFADRLDTLLRTGFHGPPAFRHDRQFFVRRRAEQEHGVLHTVDPDGTERVLIDPMEIDADGTTTLDAYHPSPDGALLAYQLSEGGTEESALRVLDVVTGEVVDGPIDRTRFSPVAWLPDGTGFYYVRQLHPDEVPADEQQYHRRVWLHRLGTDAAGDPVVFGAAHDKEFVWSLSLGPHTGPDRGRWLVVSGSKGTDPRTEVYVADLRGASPAAPGFVTVQRDVDAQTAMAVGIDGRLYVWTDLDSPRGRLLVTDPETPTREHWRPLVDEDPVAVLDGFAVLDDLDEPRLLVSRTRHAVSEVSVHDLRTGKRLGEVDLPGLGSVGGLLTRYHGGHEAWFTYTDHVTPPVVYRFDGPSGRVEEWARPPGPFPDVAGVSARLVEYTSYDGETVRMFVIAADSVHAEAGDAAAAPRPTILYGYGGFGIPMSPGFSAGALAWVETGGVYAVACLRGGGEEGEDWHRAGMGRHKQRVFDDFHAAAEWLCDHDVTAPRMLAISGGSNGGLLVGAALTQRPDLYRCVVCSAPLLDMVRFEQHGLGRFWSGEYGTAAEPDDLKNLLTYSPYHRVQAGTAYPATLFTVFGSDTRVDPLHARKMCAALQAATSADPRTHPILIRVEREVGHGARAVSRTISLSADTLAFQAWATGLSQR